MQLRLIGPEDVYYYEWDESKGNPPAVIASSAGAGVIEVWVQAQSYENASILYFKQNGLVLVPVGDLVKKA